MGRALVAGIGVGLAVAVPLGAIGLLVLRTASLRGWRAGAPAAAGVAVADLLYAGVAATAGGVLAGPIGAVAGPLRVVAAVLLLVLAARGLAAARHPAPAPAGEGSAPGLPAPAVGGYPAEAERPWRTFGGFLALTLLNPLTVLTFGAVVVALPPGLLDGVAPRVAFVLGAGAASLAWQLALAGAGSLLGSRLGPRWQRATALLGNGAIAALAVAALFA